jgi:folate-binding protein YgfZ
MSATTMGRWSQAIEQIRLTGEDTRRFLHGQSSQAIEGAAYGSCLPTCLISPTGRMRALALVRVDGNGADLLVLVGDGQAVHQALDRVLFPADRVLLGAVQPTTLVRWIGSAAPSSSEALLSSGVDLGAGSDQPAWLQQPGAALPDWLAALPELSAQASEQLRLRHGFPAAPAELNDSTNPFELGLAAWVSLNKGCYVGQETLAKLATYDGVKQQLRHWRTSSTAACVPGSSLRTAAGEKAGVITSMLTGGDGQEGLALVRRSALEASELHAGESGTTITLETPIGFVAPPVSGQR